MAGREILGAGDPVVLIDRKNRSYLRVLRPGTRLNIRGGTLLADDLIGGTEGSKVYSSAREAFFLCRPTYAQLIPNLPRKAQVIYPKDVGPILLWGDIRPGDNVVEIGTGPGALTIALLRCVGPTGRVTSYEIRDDFAEMARKNVRTFFGEAPHWVLKVADAFEGLEERQVDRLIVDLPEPWRLLPQAGEALRPGGVFVGYVPTTPQLKQLGDGLRAHGGFAAVDAMETLARFWHLDERSVRPEHRMVAHTGFMVFARRRATRDGADVSNPTGESSSDSPDISDSSDINENEGA
jgi:tRNA (adenine57-N1/adenine58-N1)-methyltransferase